MRSAQAMREARRCAQRAMAGVTCCAAARRRGAALPCYEARCARCCCHAAIYIFRRRRDAADSARYAIIRHAMRVQRYVFIVRHAAPCAMLLLNAIDAPYASVASYAYAPPALLRA
jgi:hypothetical protein